MPLASRLWAPCAAILVISACLEPGIECLSDAECAVGDRCDLNFRVCVTCDTLNDPNNCGACGNVCPSDPLGERVCSNGSCGLVCKPGYSVCDTHCSDSSSPYSCGGSCSVCNIPQGSGVYNITDAGCCKTADPTDNSCDAFCSWGAGAENCSCRFVCAAGFADCDLDAAAGATSNGCEVPLSTGQSDGQGGFKHCGACDEHCPKYPNQIPSCSGGVCSRTCITNYGDCDGDLSNGCETDLLNTAAHCNGCGQACDGCSNGKCGRLCGPGVMCYPSGSCAYCPEPCCIF